MFARKSQPIISAPYPKDYQVVDMDTSWEIIPIKDPIDDIFYRFGSINFDLSFTLGKPIMKNFNLNASDRVWNEKNVIAYLYEAADIYVKA